MLSISRPPTQSSLLFNRTVWINHHVILASYPLYFTSSLPLFISQRRTCTQTTHTHRHRTTHTHKQTETHTHAHRTTHTRRPKRALSQHPAGFCLSLTPWIQDEEVGVHCDEHVQKLPVHRLEILRFFDSRAGKISQRQLKSGKNNWAKQQGG